MPSKNLSFLVVVPGKAGNHHQKMKIFGRHGLPKPIHPVSPVINRTNAVCQGYSTTDRDVSPSDPPGRGY